MLKLILRPPNLCRSLITVQDNTMLKHMDCTFFTPTSLITVQDNTMLKPREGIE